MRKDLQGVSEKYGSCLIFFWFPLVVNLLAIGMVDMQAFIQVVLLMLIFEQRLSF